jgi:hypothetical protein
MHLFAREQFAARDVPAEVMNAIFVHMHPVNKSNCDVCRRVRTEPLVSVFDDQSSHDDQSSLDDQFLEITVIGVGPCRAANWLLNLPFRLNDAAWLSYARKRKLGERKDAQDGRRKASSNYSCSNSIVAAIHMAFVMASCMASLEFRLYRRVFLRFESSIEWLAAYAFCRAINRIE